MHVAASRRTVSDGQLASNHSTSQLSQLRLPQAVQAKFLGSLTDAPPHDTATASPDAAHSSALGVSETDQRGNLACVAAEPKQVSQAALLYGIQMLRRSGGSIRGNVSIDNTYERRLIAGAVAAPLSMSRQFQQPFVEVCQSQAGLQLVMFLSNVTRTKLQSKSCCSSCFDCFEVQYWPRQRVVCMPRHSS